MLGSRFSLIQFTDKKSLPYTLVTFSDALIIYHDGEQKPVSQAHPHYAGFNNTHDFYIAFGRMETNIDSKYCNCQIDEVQIFEVELNGEEVKWV